jgi:hypothetical protein
MRNNIAPGSISPLLVHIINHSVGVNHIDVAITSQLLIAQTLAQLPTWQDIAFNVVVHDISLALL